MLVASRVMPHVVPSIRRQVMSSYTSVMIRNMVECTNDTKSLESKIPAEVVALRVDHRRSVM